MNLDTVECAVCGRASLSVDMSLLSSATEEACSEAIEAIQGRMKELADIASTSRDRARLAEVNVELTHLSWRQPSIIRTRNKLQLAA